MADEPKTVTVKVLRDRHQFPDIDKDGKATVPEREAATLASLGLIEYKVPESAAKGAKNG